LHGLAKKSIFAKIYGIIAIFGFANYNNMGFGGALQ
jgi:hypothetical protein